MLTVDAFKQNYLRLNGTKNIIVGFSGGLDSTVLLELFYLAFNNEEYTITACHVNHKLQPGSDIWEKHCLQLCTQKRIPIIIKTLQNPICHNIEETARHMRMEIFNSLVKPTDTLVLAHHADDQAETILQRLCRGTGMQGLQGMLETRPFWQGVLIRPLLTYTRAQIEEFALSHKLTWINDPSNSDIRFSRNFLRKKAIPLLQTMWPKCVQNINRLGMLMTQHVAYTEQQLVKDLLVVHGTKNNTLSIKKLLLLPNEQIKALLRCWIKKLGYQMPSNKKLILTIQEVLLAKKNNSAHLKIDNYFIRRYRDDLYITQEITTYTDWECLVTTKTEPVLLPNGKRIVLYAQDQNLIVKLVSGSHGNKAKKIFQQFKVPTWERAKYILVFIDKQTASNSKDTLPANQNHNYSSMELIQILDLWQNPCYKDSIYCSCS